MSQISNKSPLEGMEEHRTRFSARNPYVMNRLTGGGGPMDPIDGTDYVNAKLGEARAELRLELKDTESRLGDKIGGLERQIADLASNLRADFHSISTRLDHTATTGSVVLSVAGGVATIVGLVFALLAYSGDRADQAFERGQQIEARFEAIENRAGAADNSVGNTVVANEAGSPER